MQAATGNSRVLERPGPHHLLPHLRPSTLDHELRFFVSGWDRNPAIDELNRRIDVLFREHGIEIAFNQMDVYIKNMQETNRRWNPRQRCHGEEPAV